MALQGVTRTGTVGAASWSADSAVVGALDGTIQLCSTDPQRVAVTIVNDAASTGDLFIVATTGQRRGGVRIAPGAGYIVGSVAPIYGYVPVGMATVYLLAESGVAC